MDAVRSTKCTFPTPTMNIAEINVLSAQKSSKTDCMSMLYGYLSRISSKCKYLDDLGFSYLQTNSSLKEVINLN